MKMTIASTGQVVDLDGVEARLWEGVTERGVRCKVFVHRIAVLEGEDASQFDAELKERPNPSAPLGPAVWSLRQIL